MTCTQCGATYQDGDKFCEECGVGLAAALPGPGCECDAGAPDADGFCDNCGRRLTSTDRVEHDLGPIGACVSDPGRRRSRNEDAGSITSTTDGIAAAVSDGVSNGPDPRAASTGAANAAVESLAEGADPVAAVGAAVRAVAAATDPVLLDSTGHALPDVEVPACTLVVAHVCGSRFTIADVGDSRAYWVPLDGTPEQISVDDSWAAEVIAAGMNEADAFADRRAHTITAWLGADSGPVQPHVAEVVATVPGILVLCTDGLWNYAPSPAALGQIVVDLWTAATGSPIETARRLVDFAREAGGADNITVAVIPITPEGDQP